jgi:hypothetical protein
MQQQRQQQIPPLRCGMTTKGATTKTKDNDNSNDKNNDNSNY